MAQTFSLSQNLPNWGLTENRIGQPGIFGANTGNYTMTTSGATAAASSTVVLTGNTNIAVGQFVSGYGIPANTMVSGLATNTITLTNATNAAIASGTTLTFTNNSFYAPDQETSTTPKIILGTVARFKDTLLGFGECDFIYLPLNSAITAVGLACVYDLTQQTVSSVVTPTNAASYAGPVAFSTSVWNASGLSVQYGWFQVFGPSLVNVGANTVAAGNRTYTSATAGVLKTSGTAGQAIDSARFTQAGGSVIGTAPIQLALPTSIAIAQIDYPAFNGNG